MALLEWLANNYKTFGATLEIVTDRSQEAAQFVRGFGGMGGVLSGLRAFCNYKAEAAHELEARFKQVQPEVPLYNEDEVRRMLSDYPGGAVHLDKNEKWGKATITIQNPKSKNAFTGQMMLELSDHVSSLSDWSQGRVICVRGAEGDFCAGGDIDFVRQITDPVQGAKMSIFMQTTLSRLFCLPMVTIAQISGHALGGGAELAVACDLRVMQESAKIGFVQGRLGLSTGWAGATHLRRHVARSVALRLLTTAKVLTASEAFSVGLADEIVKTEAESEKYIENYTNPEISFVAQRAAKRLILNMDEPSAYMKTLDRERHEFTRLWGADENLRLMHKILAKLGKS